MIVIDIETSGLDYNKCGIWQIGAIDLDLGKDFLEEARIDDEDEIMQEALEITGKTENELRDKSKQSQKQLIENFFKWAEKIKIKNLICQGPQFDFAFIRVKADKYNLEFPFPHRAFDLHSIAQTIYFLKNKKFLIEKSESALGLTKILEMIGKEDERRENVDGKITEGKPHNALEDCKLEAECFEKLMEELR